MTEEQLPELFASKEEEEAFEAEVRERALAIRQQNTDMVHRCAHRFRAALAWASIRDEEHLAELASKVENDMASGDFWLARIGLIAQTDPELVFTLRIIRQQWLDEFQAVSMPERILVDQAMIALYHYLRLHEMTGNIQGLAEHDFFGVEPLRAVSFDRDGIRQYEVDEHLKKIAGELLTSMARCHRMITSSLRELVRWKRTPWVKIHNEGQLNLGHQQLNLATPPAEATAEEPAPRKRGRPRKPGRTVH